jgi:HD-GYP domain-containing protein (c-di-GMP phosphodiesterase class II)
MTVKADVIIPTHDHANLLPMSIESACAQSVGDIRIVGPAVMAVLAIVLIVQTRGVYTRWLAVNIIVCVLALTFGLYLNLDQEDLQKLGIGAILHDTGKMRIPDRKSVV